MKMFACMSKFLKGYNVPQVHPAHTTKTIIKLATERGKEVFEINQNLNSTTCEPIRAWRSRTLD